MKPWTLADFVRESNRIEGVDRTTAAHVAAHRAFLFEPASVETLIKLVGVLQPNARYRGNENVPGVRVGNHIAPPSGPAIQYALLDILAMRDPWEQHVAYETLHPFTDGNGRSGRALWLHRHNGHAPIGFLHSFYYQTLSHSPLRALTESRTNGR